MVSASWTEKSKKIQQGQRRNLIQELKVNCGDLHFPSVQQNKRQVTHLLVKVGFGELQRVEQGIGGGQFDVVAGLLLPHALDDCRQDLVGVVLQLLWVLATQQGVQTGA